MVYAKKQEIQKNKLAFWLSGIYDANE